LHRIESSPKSLTRLFNFTSTFGFRQQDGEEEVRASPSGSDNGNLIAVAGEDSTEMQVRMQIMAFSHLS
jgi:hypothetical protein